MKVKFALVCLSTLFLIFGTAHAQNSPPVLDPIGDQTVPENTFWQLPVHASDVDPGNVLTMTTSTLPGTAYSVDAGNGVLTLYWNLTYTDSGTYPITVTVSDGASTDQETFNLIVTNVNRKPVLTPIGAQSAIQTVPLDIALSATDGDSEPMDFWMQSDSTDITSTAIFTDNGNGTADFSWTSPLGLQGKSYPVKFYVSDGIDTVMEQVSITVLGVPQFIQLADTTIQFTKTLALSVVTSDADGDFAVLEINNVFPDTSYHGTLPPAAVFTDNGDGTGQLDWVTTEADTGKYGLQFVAIDNGVSPPDTVTKTITLRVNAYNRLPVLDPIADQAVAQGDTLVVNLSATDLDSDDNLFFRVNPVKYRSWIVNNGDGTGLFYWAPDFSKASFKQSLTFYVTDSLPPDTIINGNDTSIVVLPGAGADSQAIEVTVTVVQNVPPILAAIGTRVATVGAPLNFAVSATDPNGTTPALSIKNKPSAASFTDNGDGTGSFSWTPSAGQIGNSFVTFFASDNIFVDSEVVKITVNPAGNQAPVLTVFPDSSFKEGIAFTRVVSAVDPDGTVPSLTASDMPPGATFVDNGNGTGTFSWTPSFIQAGIYEISFIASDGSLADTKSVTLTIKEAGDQKPIISGGGPYSVNESQLLSFMVTGYDPEGGRLIYLTAGLPAGATITDYGNDTALFSWTPSYCQSTVTQIRIRARVTTDTGQVIIPVTVANTGDQPPVLNPISGKVFTDKVGSAYTDSTIYSDIDTIVVYEGDSLRITPSAQLFPGCPVPPLGTSILPAAATFTSSNGSGTMRWVVGFTQGNSPTDSFVIYSIIFFADDLTLPVDRDTIYIMVVNAENQLPVFDALSVTNYKVYADRNPLIQFNVVARDKDSTIATLTSSTLPGAAAFVDNGNNTGTFSWSPLPSDVGKDTVHFYATDPAGGADTVTVTFEVLPGSGQIVIDSVGGSPGSGQIVACNDISFYMSMKNNTGYQYDVATNALRVYSPGTGANKATWSTMTADLTGSQASPTVVYRYGTAQGSGADTARFTVSNVLTSLDGHIWTIKIGPIGPEHIGKQICIGKVDSIGTSKTWLWSDIFGLGDGIQPAVTPAWNGPYCYTIVADAGNNLPVFSGASMFNDTTIVECENLVLDMDATDVDGDPLTFTVDTLFSGAALTSTGATSAQYTWSPDGLRAVNENPTTYTVKFRVSDGCGIVERTVNITVTPEPAPVLSTIANKTFNACEEDSIKLSVFSRGGPALNAGAFTMQVLSTPAIAGTYSIAHSAGSDTAIFHFTPASSDIRTHQVRFKVVDSDCGSIDSQTVTLTVVPATAPTVTSFDTLNVATDSIAVVECQQVAIMLKANDPNGLSVTWTTPDNPGIGTFSPTTGDSTIWKWTPGFEFASSYDIRFAATNTCQGIGSKTVKVVVLPNLPPVMNLSTFISRKGLETGDTTLYQAGDTVVVTVVGNDPDSTGNVAVTFLDTLPTGGTFVQNGKGVGVFTFRTALNAKGVYTLRFKADDGCGNSTGSITLMDTVLWGTTGISSEEQNVLPEEYALSQNYPNPFNPVTTITLDLPKASSVRLEVFNVLGQRIRTLVDQRMSPGRYHVDWDGTNESGISVATGIYFYRLETSDFVETKKMLLMK